MVQEGEVPMAERHESSRQRLDMVHRDWASNTDLGEGRQDFYHALLIRNEVRLSCGPELPTKEPESSCSNRCLVLL